MLRATLNFSILPFFYSKLKITIAIIATLLICGITTFFLFPRSPTLHLVSVTMHNASFPEMELEDAYILIKVSARPTDQIAFLNVALVLCPEVNLNACTTKLATEVQQR